MKKKIFKYSIIAMLILIITIVTCVILNKKDITFSSIFGQTKGMLEGTQTSTSDELEYNTEGDDSANYKDGDITKEKSGWVQNGDTWTYTFYVDDPNAQWYIWEDSETLMDGYSGDFTENNVGTLFEEETLNEFTPDESYMAKKEIEGKNVYTWLDSEKAYKVTDNGDGTYTKIITKLSFTITNTKEGTQSPEEAGYGSLTINKVVKDKDNNELTENDDNTNFTFTITLTAGSANSKLIEGTKIFGNMVFKNGVATVSLKAGGSVIISDIPVGVSYNVTENSVSGYETSYESATGTISKNVESVVNITNKKIKTQTPDDSGSSTEEPEDPSQKHVDITLKKAVTGNYENDDSYNFEITLTNLTANKTYKIEKIAGGTATTQEESFTSDDVGSANVSVSLKKDEYAILKDIPVGAKYKVFEYAGDYISSYSITDSKSLGKIESTANLNTKQNKALSTATETADEGEEVTITYTNKKELTQNLKIAKEVTGENDTNTYTFEIAFSNMPEGTSFNSTVGKITADQEGEALLTIYLVGGEDAEFYNVPVGTKYQVTELASTAIASYTITDSNGTNKIARASNANSKSKTPLSTESETVNEGEEATITFINDIVNLSEEESAEDSVEVSLGVTKVVLNSNDKVVENCKDTFTFELKAKDQSYPMPGEVSGNGQENANTKIATITGNGTASFGTITFTETGTYTYTITEVVGDSEDYTYDKATYTIVYEVTNESGLLEVTKTVKKNGFKGDTITFTNKTDKYNEEEPENPNKPFNVDDEDKGDSNKLEDEEQPSNETKKDNDEGVVERIVTFVTTGTLPKTGDFVAVYVILAVIAILGVVFVIIKNKKDKK